jgi:hypothetical protein
VIRKKGGPSSTQTEPLNRSRDLPLSRHNRHHSHTTTRLFLPVFFVPFLSPCHTWIPCAKTTRVTRLQIQNGVPGLKLCSASANLHRTPLFCSSTWFALFRFKTRSRYRQSVTPPGWQGWLCYPCFIFDIACSYHPEAVDNVTCGWVTSCARA